MATSPRARSLRWFAPLAAIAAIALIAAVPSLSAADTPKLQPVTAQQLIVKVQQADVKALSGTIELKTNLGIPNLGALSQAAGGGGGRRGGGGFNPTDLLSGSHKALVWSDGQDRSRIALLQSMAEVDVVHNGHDIWTWDSTTKKVAHYVLAASTDPAHAASRAEPATEDPIQTPAQMAQAMLDKIGPSTAIAVTSTHYVADQAVYQLVLTPKLASSTVDHVVIAIDSRTGLPLQVQVFAKGQKATAVQLGFSSIDYAVPAASNFNFTPPPGSTVTTKQQGRDPATSDTTTKPAAGPPDKSTTDPTVVGQDWASVAIFKNVQLPAQAGEFLRAATAVEGGKLLSTSLVNILVLDDGRIAVGAVNPAALQAAVASAR